MMRKLSSLLIFALVFCPTGFAADIIKIKGSSALIDLKGEPATVGDMFYALTADGKKHAVIEIAKVKGDKAIGRVTKGKADVGMTLEPKAPGSTAPVATNKPMKSRKSQSGSSNMYWGGMAGYAMDSMKVKVLWQTAGPGHAVGDEKEVAALTGSSFSAVGLFDYDMGQFGIRSFAGLESFGVSGVSSCGAGNNEACTSKIIYLEGGALARYKLLNGDFRPWVGVGMNVLFPATKSGTALDSSSVSSTWMALFAGGMDIFVNKSMYVPISLEYGMFPKSDQVEASWIQFRVGLAVPL